MGNWERIFYNNIGQYYSIISESLSDNYELKPLGEYIKIIGGYSFKSSQYKPIGIPVIRISDFQNERIDLTNAKYYEENDDLANYELNEGDIIIAMTGGTIGKLAIVQGGLGKIYLNQRVGKFKTKSAEDFEPEFVYWIARGVESKIKGLAWGAAIPNVSGKQIESLKFVIPSKDVQKRIIEFFKDLRDKSLRNYEYFNLRAEERIIRLQNDSNSKDQIIQEQTNQLELLKKLRQQILQDAVMGRLVEQDPNDETAISLLEKITTERKKLLAEGKISRSKPLPNVSGDDKPFEIPSSWEWCRLGNYGTCRTGTTPPTSHKEYFGKDIPFVKPADISLKHIDYTNEGLTFEGLNNGVLIPENSVLMVCIGGSIGKSFYSIRDVSCNQQINSITPLAGIDAVFLNNIMQTPYFQKSIWDKASGGATPIVNRSKWESIPLPLPPLNEQHRIVAKVEQLMKICDDLEQSIQQNRKYTQDLLQIALKEALEANS